MSEDKKLKDDNFIIPSFEAIEIAEKALEGSGKAIVNAWLERQKTINVILIEEAKVKQEIAKINQQNKTHSMFYGSMLALSALGLGAWGIHNKSDLLSLAALITPIAGLAGVFIWGYQRKD